MIQKRVRCWTDIVYGPISSRRLGLSLGLNLFPQRKVCNFNCVYCHFGATERKAASNGGRPLPAPADVRRALAAHLAHLGPPEVITFAGNGEPTLHPRFPEIVREVVAVRDRLAPGVPLAILSNSTRAHRPRIREALMALDQRIMKLDAAEPRTFRLMARPRQAVRFDDVARGLEGLRPLFVQSLFVEGDEVENCSREKVDRLVRALRRIRPCEVEVYTATRWTAENFIKPVDRRRLDRIAETMNAAGIRARVY
jgi:wyosine [tRNA(Phe)-imidazoG37] synthetase (radical SAM superfamily)